jgi:integrase
MGFIMAEHLTDRLVKALQPPARTSHITHDDEVRGFGIRITAANARSFVVRYRRKSDGQQRTCTIGSFPDWKTAAARERAKEIKRAVDGGGDPVGDEQELRDAATVNDLLDRFEADVLPRNRATTQRSYRSQIRAEIRPRLGRMKVEAVRFSDIDKVHRDLSAKPYQANRVIALLSRIFSMAVKWQLRSDNPCKGIERNTEDRRERYLSPDEIIRLSDALDAYNDQQTADIVRLLLLCGARLGEVVQARWADIDLEIGRWIKPSAHTKQRKQHVLPLSAAAVQLLRKVRADIPRDCPWVFPANDGIAHRVAIRNGWASICDMAKIENCRVHDLRHTHASILINQNYSLPIVGRLLGHTVPSTTARYAHLADDPLRRAVEDAANAITRKPSGEVVTLPERRRK